MAFLKKNTADAGKPRRCTGSYRASPRKEEGSKTPCGSWREDDLRFGDIAVCGATALMVVTIALQLLSLKALFLF